MQIFSRFFLGVLIANSLSFVSKTSAQTIEITGVPTAGAAGQVTGNVSGVNFSTHEVAVYLYIDGVGWWSKPNGGPVSINPDGTFSANIGLDGLDEYATTYAVSVVPNNVLPPFNFGTSTLNLGNNSLATTYEQRYGRNINFAGHTWGVKDIPGTAGPGGNRFSADPSDVWVDSDGLHLTISNNGGVWESTEVILPENLGYGTYMFQTTSRQDILDANTVFGAFTWDRFGDDTDQPAWPHREIDFEDSRWGNPANPFNSQVVIQPFNAPGALESITLPDLSTNAELTRFFVWSPDKVEFFTLLGHHDPSNYPESAVIDRTVMVENLPPGLLVPEPGRENFHFNLWQINGSTPLGGQTVEVVINDFQYTPLSPSDLNQNGYVDSVDLGILLGSWNATTTPEFGELDGTPPVDGVDLGILLGDWNPPPSFSAATAVPEPSGLFLTLVSTIVLFHHNNR